MDPITRNTRGLVLSLAVASCGFPRPPDVGPEGGDDAGPQAPGYQLLAVTPAIATAGDTLTLEGTFGADAMLQFPGGVVRPATVLGEHRATVVVPDSATAGDLTVSTAGVTVGPLRFRRTSFSLGLQPFRIAYEQTDGARQSPALRIARSAPTAAVIKGWLYVVGGDSGSGPVNSVERAPTNADGTLDAFDLVGDVSLVEARAGHTSAVIGSSLFAIGGSGSSGALRSVERAAINADGSLGRFATVSDAALVTARAGHASAILGSFLYVVGGASNDGSKLASIERAAIRADGSLGPFATVDAALTIARSGHTVELIGNALYVIGGSASGNAPSGSVERAAIAADGSLGAFAAVPGSALTTPRSGHRTAVLGAAVYALGGSASGGAIAGIERAAISSDGSLGPFSVASGTALTSARTGHALATVGTSLHAIGGSRAGAPARVIERASINLDGAISAFTESNTSLVLPRVHDAATVIRDFIYVTGRSSNDMTVERATVQPDGSLSAFAITANPLATSRSGHAVARIGRYLYLLGGSTSERTSSIERAIIDTDGSLGQFVAVPAGLVEVRAGAVSVALGGFLYVLGGIGATQRPASVERAVINDDDSLGPFAVVPGVVLNTSRNFFTALVTDQYLYVMGGLADTVAATDSVERAAIGPDGSLGAFAVVSALHESRGAHGCAVVGNGLYVIGGLIAGVYRASVERAIVNPDGSLGGFEIVSGATMLRARHTAATLGNTLYLLGGVTELPNGETVSLLDLARADLR